MKSSGDNPAYSRDETSGERLDRNWNELLQELRVMQTGVQLLTGFLLTIPFQSRFEDLNGRQIALFLTLVVLASLTTIALLGVVQLHRTLFRQSRRDSLVAHADRIVRGTIVLIGALLLGVCVLIFDVTLGPVVAWLVGIALLVLAALAWGVYPNRVLAAHERTASSKE